MMREGILAVAAMAAASLWSGACAQETGGRSPAQLTDAGMFYVGGRVEPGAAQHTGQALIHYFKSDASPRMPVVLYPGLGLSSYIYISTPDGRSGWAQQFARAGHAAYVYDPVNTGPSGLPVAPFRDGSGTALAIWNPNQIWRRWGFGEAPDQPYENVRFPVQSIDQFYASWPLRLAGAMGAGGAGRGMGSSAMGAGGAGRGMGSSAMGAGGAGRGMGSAALGAGATGAGMGMGVQMENAAAEAAGGGGRQGRGGTENAAALTALLERIGRAILVPHSMGGSTVFQVARKRPELVAGIVAVEPLGCPRTAQQVRPWAQHAPFLAVYGDYIEQRGQTGRLQACRETARLVNAAGGQGRLLELTREGIFGNTHLLMQDDNSAEIAARIIAWAADSLGS